MEESKDLLKNADNILQKVISGLMDITDTLSKLSADAISDSANKTSIKYPDFDTWEDNSISLLNGELILAPEDFYVIDKNGEKKEYFTWDEAMEYEEKVLKPNGWRLPTCRELCLIAANYVNEEGNDDTELFMDELHANLKGHKDEDGNINYVGSRGYWWSSTAASSTDARRLSFGSGYFYPQYNNAKGYGFAVRCVAQ